ncbi:hypothetical protein BC938DRAFT_479892, partial [Jimgerdemannia flammicorona]
MLQTLSYHQAPVVLSTPALPIVRWLFAHPNGWTTFDPVTERAIENYWDNGTEYTYVTDSHFCDHVLVHLGELYVEVGGRKYAIAPIHPTVRSTAHHRNSTPSPHLVGCRMAHPSPTVAVLLLAEVATPPPALGQQVVVDAEKLTTLFIGNIPPGIGDAWMEKVLKVISQLYASPLVVEAGKTCGTLNKWKRVKDQSGNLQKFGFAEYADPEGVLRALRVIGGEGAMETLMFPALDGSGVTKKLI